MAERAVMVDGLRLRYLEEGEGPAVIMLHGASAGSSADVYVDNLPAFAEAGLRAIAIDRLGYGMSDDPVEPTMAYEIQFLEHFLDRLGIPSACIVGHSQSATPAAMMALDKPARVPRLVALGALLPPLPGGGPANIPDLQGKPSIESLRELLSEHVYDQSLLTQERLERRLSMITGRNYERYQHRQAQRTGPRGGANAELWERMTQQPERFMIVQGSEDGHFLDDGRQTSSARADQARRLCPAMEIVLIASCGHLAQWDAPAEFAAHATRFIKAAAMSAAAAKAL